MYMIFICSYFKKIDLITLGYFYTNIFQDSINLFVYHCSPVFGWTHKMIDQNGYIMTASDKMTHTPILSRRKRRGMYPEMESMCYASAAEKLNEIQSL